MSNPAIHHPASYRDPSGFVFIKNKIIYRQVNGIFKEHFDKTVVNADLSIACTEAEKIVAEFLNR